MESVESLFKNQNFSAVYGVVAIGVVAVGYTLNFLMRSGVFMPICFVERTTPDNIKVIAKGYKTAYKNVPKAYDQMFKLINDNLLQSSDDKRIFYENINLVGIYFDDPKVVGENETRFAIGIAIDTCGNKFSEKCEKLFVENGYKSASISKQKSFMTLFPNVGIFSILVGVRKVYPAAEIYNNNRYDSASGFKFVYEITHKDVNEFHFVLEKPTDEIKSLVGNL